MSSWRVTGDVIVLSFKVALCLFLRGAHWCSAVVCPAVLYVCCVNVTNSYALPLSLCGQTKLPAGVSSLFIVTTQYWYTYWHLKPFKALECWYLSVVECTWICGCARTFVCTPLENTSLPIMKFHWYHRQHRVIELRGDLSTFVCMCVCVCGVEWMCAWHVRCCALKRLTVCLIRRRTFASLIVCSSLSWVNRSPQFYLLDWLIETVLWLWVSYCNMFGRSRNDIS